MSYNYCKDHRSGITYVYEMVKSIDESSGKPKTERKLVGKLNEEGNIVPTSGRKGRLPKKNATWHSGETDTSEDVESLKEEIETLKRTIAILRRNHQDMIKGLESLLTLARQQAQNEAPKNAGN